jgi:hypothetical protein
MRTASRGAARFGPYAAIALAAAVFFSPFLLQGRIFVAADTLLQYYPWRSFAPPQFRPHNPLITDPVNHNYAQLYSDQLKAGGLRNWNPYLLGGLPANGITALSGMPGRYNPLKLLLHRFLEPPEALCALLFLSVLLMGVTMYAYLLRIGARRVGALFGAVAFMFNGTAMVWLEFENLVTAAAFLPLLLLCMEWFLEARRRVPAACLGALALGLVALMGHLQYLIYTALLLLFYLAFLLWRLRASGAGRRDALAVLACFAATCAGGALIGAVDLLPVLELMRQSSRIGRVFTFTGFFETLGRVPGAFYLTLLFPFFFGSPHLWFDLIPRLPTQEYMNYNELCLYLGVPVLFGLAAALAARKSRHAWFHLGMTALVAAMMSGTAAYYPFFVLFPGMDRMNPTRLVFLFSFTAAAAAGIGVGRLGTLAGRRRAAFVVAAGALVATAAVFAFFGATPAVIGWLNPAFGAHLAAGGPGDLAAVRQLLGIASPLVLKPLLIAVAAAAIAVALALLRPGRLRIGAAGALVALLAFDLIGFGREYNTVVERGAIFPRTPAIDFLLAQPRPFRVQLGQGTFINSLAPFRIESVGGYSSFYPEGTNALMSYLENPQAARGGWRFDRWVELSNPGIAALDFMNVRYVLAAPGVRLPGPRFRLVHQGDLTIYENTRALPRAWVVPRAVAIPDRPQALAYVTSPAFEPLREVVIDDPAAAQGGGQSPAPGAAVIERYEEDDVVVATQSPAPAWLVLADTWYPGWRASVNGAAAPIQRANVNFRAVRIPAGQSRVVFAFRPAAVRWGTALTLLGVAFPLGGLGLWWRQRRRRVRA